MVGSVLGFLAVATVAILAPGPDSLLVMRHTISRGRLGGLITAAGTLTGLCCWAVAASLGLAALVRASQLGYDMLRIAGALYLMWLGISALRAKPAEAPADETDSRTSRWRMYLMGTLSNLLNPKIGVFFIALLPGFIPAGEPVATNSLLLGALFVIETGLWLAVLSALVARGSRWLQAPQVRKVIDRITGLLLIGFGIRLATQARVA